MALRKISLACCNRIISSVRYGGCVSSWPRGWRKAKGVAIIPDPSRGAYARPVYLIKTLTVPEEVIANATYEQLTLTAYLERLTVYLTAKPHQDEAHKRATQAVALEPPARPKHIKADNRRY